MMFTVEEEHCKFVLQYIAYFIGDQQCFYILCIFVNMSYCHLKSFNFVIFDGKSAYNDVAILFIPNIINCIKRQL